MVLIIGEVIVFGWFVGLLLLVGVVVVVVGVVGVVVGMVIWFIICVWWFM